MVKAGDVSEDMVVYAACRAGDEKQEELWGNKETADRMRRYHYDCSSEVPVLGRNRKLGEKAQATTKQKLWP